MILDLVASLGPWTWMIVGVLLLAAEIALPGNILVWFGIAALLVGGLALLTDVAWQVELVLFAVLSVLLVVAGRRYFRRSDTSDEPFLNRRADRLVGQVHVLREPVVDGKGRLRIDDANWRISGLDMPSGTRVKIVGHDGPVLAVRREG